MNDLRILFAEQDRNAVSVSRSLIFVYPNTNTLINRYNAPILQLTTTLKGKEMLASNVFRVTEQGMGDEDSDAAYTYSGSAGGAMRDLIHHTKIALLSVCDGYSIKNPYKELSV